jgi:hypothetical protein
MRGLITTRNVNVADLLAFELTTRVDRNGLESDDSNQYLTGVNGDKMDLINDKSRCDMWAINGADMGRENCTFTALKAKPFADLVTTLPVDHPQVKWPQRICNFLGSHIRIEEVTQEELSKLQV